MFYHVRSGARGMTCNMSWLVNVSWSVILASYHHQGGLLSLDECCKVPPSELCSASAYA